MRRGGVRVYPSMKVISKFNPEKGESPFKGLISYGERAQERLGTLHTGGGVSPRVRGDSSLGGAQPVRTIRGGILSALEEGVT